MYIDVQNAQGACTNFYISFILSQALKHSDSQTNSVIGGGSALTCGNGAHQHGVELDDGAEDVLGVGGAGQVLAVALEDEALVLLL